MFEISIFSGSDFITTIYRTVKDGITIEKQAENYIKEKGIENGSFCYEYVMQGDD